MRATAFNAKLVSFGRSPSLREECISRLQNAKTAIGQIIPVTAPEIRNQLENEGWSVKVEDIQALLVELCSEGVIREIDPAAGFKWIGAVA
jgi:hypothetical protein